MWFLLGCGPVLVGPAGEEQLRAALLFEEEDRNWVLLANSYVPCTVDTPDNPATIQDEAAIAISYRSAQIAAALTREGALLVALDMPGEGNWEVGGENWGAWYYVEEAMRYGQDGMIATYLPTVVQKNLDVRSGEMTLENGRGSFLFEEDGVSGRFVAEACDDPILRQQILSRLSSAGSVILN